VHAAGIDHSAQGIAVMSQMSQFFVNQARLSNRAFPSELELESVCFSFFVFSRFRVFSPRPAYFFTQRCAGSDLPICSNLHRRRGAFVRTGACPLQIYQGHSCCKHQR
jgi:hypothetical protein